MSVFQLEEWWSIKVGQDGAVSSGGAGGGMDGREQPRGEEEFDAGCMCLGNMDNASPPSGETIYVLHRVLVVYSLFTFESLALFYLNTMYNAMCVCAEKIVVASLQGIIRIYHPTKAGFSGGRIHILIHMYHLYLLYFYPNLLIFLALMSRLYGRVHLSARVVICIRILMCLHLYLTRSGGLDSRGEHGAADSSGAVRAVHSLLAQHAGAGRAAP